MPLPWDVFWTIIAQVMIVIALIVAIIWVGSAVYVDIYNRIWGENE